MQLIKKPFYLQSEPPQPTGVVIWLHGLGATHTDLYTGLWQAVSPICQQQYRAIFLQAPDRTISVSGGMQMPAWYDIYDLSLEAPTDSAGLYASVKTVQQVIASQALDAAVAERIIVAGFSQGGALALHAGLRASHPIYQIHVLSGYVPMEQSLSTEVAKVNASCPVYFYHGSEDAVLPESFMQQGARHLASSGIPVHMQSFNAGHSVCPEALSSLESCLIQ